VVISGGADERCAAALPSCGDGPGVGGVEPCAYRGRCSGFGTPRRLVGLAAGEESGALVHITWYLETQTVHRFAALPAWLGEDMTVYRGDNQDPAFIAKIRKLSSQQQDWPRHILNDDDYFRVL
jgi:hypothetical protein